MRTIVGTTLVLLSAIPLVAQPFTTNTVAVVLEGCPVTPPVITVVANGNETTAFKVEHVEANLWRADLSRTFDARGQRASLRLGGARTGCETSQEKRDPRDPNHWMAVFRFHCTQERFWSSLSIETTPPTVPMQYKRLMSDSGCVDSRAEITGMAEINDVAVYNESIYVNLGDYDPLRPYTDYAVAIDKGVFGRHALGPGTFALPRAMVLTDLMLRRSKNPLASPTISDNLRSVRGRDVVPFDKITMTVK
jgi:hypothetical protein